MYAYADGADDDDSDEVESASDEEGEGGSNPAGGVGFNAFLLVLPRLLDMGYQVGAARLCMLFTLRLIVPKIAVGQEF